MCGSEVRWGRSVWVGIELIELRNESIGKGNSLWVYVWHSLDCGGSSVSDCGWSLDCGWSSEWLWVDQCEWVSSMISSFSLSLSLFKHLMSPEIVWSENKNLNQFPGQSHKTHGQMKCFSEKFYFPCATKHTVSCKIISWNGFTPKQM